MAIKTFTTGEVLTASDTNTYLANSGLVYVTSATVGAGSANKTVTGAFSSTYDSYVVTYTGGTLSAGSKIGVYMSGATGTAYYGGRAATTAAGATSPAGDNNTNQWTQVSFGDTINAYMYLIIGQPNLAQTTTISSVYTEAAGAGSIFGTYTGFLYDSTQYTSFTIDPAGATTMSGGVITVYGMRKT